MAQVNIVQERVVFELKVATCYNHKEANCYIVLFLNYKKNNNLIT